jgi:predicted site-specific integrase-resolvase
MLASAPANIRLMKTVGYVRVSTDKQAEHGVSLEAQEAKIRAMATLHGTELSEVIVDGGESAKGLNRPGIARLLARVDAGSVKVVIVAKLDRLTRSVKDLCELLERFERRGVSLVSVAESLDTGSAAGRLVLNIMTRRFRNGRGKRSANAPATPCATSGARASGWATSRSAPGSAGTASGWSRIRRSRMRWNRSERCATRARPCAGSPPRSTTGPTEPAGGRPGGWSQWRESLKPVERRLRGKSNPP